MAPDSPVSVTVTPSHRVGDLTVHAPDAVRTPAALDAAVQQAHRRAVVAATSVSPVSGQQTDARPVPKATGATLISRRQDLLDRHRIRVETTAGGRRPRRPGPALGVSDNECVRVELLPGSSRGVVDADPGWLSQATASQIGQAVGQAFHHAYDERDR